MPIEILDIIVIVVVLISAILAMVRGFVREVLSIASWLAAAAAAYFLYKSLLPLVSPYFDSEPVATIVSAAIIFFVALIIASYVTMKIADYVIDSRVGAADRAFGFVFGAARGLLLLVVAMHFFNALVPKPPAWVAQARTKPMLDVLDAKLTAILPKDLEGLLSKKPATEDDSPDVPGESPEPPAGPAVTPANPTTGSIEPAPKYNDDALQRMIENSDANPPKRAN
ncbi:MAG TPA: CvpA family protein [Bauldia sp.]|nr:CvpA family protein [Bauldia sp.]